MDGLMKGYAYDLTGELRQSQHSLNGRTQHKYDATGRIEESLRAARQAGANSKVAADPNRSESFGYDPAGNLLNDLSNRASNQTQGQNRGYVRDNLVRVFEDKRYAYDGHGRLLQKLNGKHTKQSFQWDDEHRLIAITTTRRPNTPEAATQTVKFDYDAIGRRVAKHDSFGTTRFIWEGMRLIEERRGQSVVTYVYEPNSYVPLARIDATGQATEVGGVGTTKDALPLDAEAAANDAVSDATSAGSENTASNIYYFHTDQVGLPEELSDSEGTIRWRASYKTWGNAVSESWEAVALNGDSLNATAFAKEAKPLEVQQNLRFQGQYLDRESGLHYNTFRFYDPDIGRFISPDPIGLAGGENLHSYGSNPISVIDPWGLTGDDLVRYKPDPTITPQAGGRGTAINRAWGQERELVKAGGGSRAWTDAEKQTILNTKNNGQLSSVMSEKGYTGHHINSVKGIGTLGTAWKGDPRNIVFLENANHPGGADRHLNSNQGHRGNYQNNGKGRLIDRNATTRNMKSGC